MCGCLITMFQTITLRPFNPKLFQEELQESKDQYRDLERNLQQFKTLEKKLIDKDDAVSWNQEILGPDWLITRHVT